MSPNDIDAILWANIGRHYLILRFNALNVDRKKEDSKKGPPE